MQKQSQAPELQPSDTILILGGARSGKSAFAEKLARQSGRPVAFIATATAGDSDMHERIQHHRASRPASWHTIEEPLKLAHALREAAAVADILLLDCITLWLSNWLLAQDDPRLVEAVAVDSHYLDSALAEIDEMLTTLATLPDHKTLLIVTNEVGLGIVPSHALGRIYRDVLGRVNQRLASQAKRVYLMVAGLGVDIKRLHEEARL